MSRSLFITITLFFSLKAQVGAQNVDSLLHRIEQSGNTVEKVNLFIKVGHIVEKQSLDSGLFYHNKALDLAQETSYDTLIAKCYSALGGTNILKGNFELSLDYQLKARAIYQNYPDNDGNLLVYNSMGLIYFYQQNYESALSNFLTSESLIDKFHKNDTITANQTRGRLFNNIGIVYDNTGKYDLALEYFARASTMSKRANDMRTLPSIYSNMGIIYIKTDRYALAESIFKEAFEIRKEQGDNHGLCKSYFHLGTVYSAEGDLELAIENLILAITYCEIANSMPGKAAALNQLSLSLAENGNFDEAYKRQVEYKVLSDSLFKLETQGKITQAEMQFEYEKEKQALESQRSRKELIYVIIATILVFSVIILVVMYILQKTKAKNQQLAKEKAEFERNAVELTNKELSLRKQNLEYDLELKNKELTTNVMYLLKKNELITEISERLIDLKKELKKDNQHIIQKIIFDLRNAQDDDVWEEFEIRFNQVYNDFYERLHEKFPNLTPSEKKICAFLRLNMTTKEICALTRQSYNSLNVARARLRKKLNLDNTDTNLVNFLETV